MKLKIDDTPKVDTLKFLTLQREYAHTVSPRSIVQQTGMEFDHYRKYLPSDDAAKIDWKASARSTELLVRVFSEDISMNVLVMVDVSESMIYGTGDKAKIEFAIELALNISYGCLNFGDQVGLMLFNDDVVNTVPFGGEEGQFGAIKQILEKTEGFGGKSDLGKPLSWIVETFKDTHLVILISDFLGFEKDFERQLYAVVDHFDMVGIMVNDKTDISLDEPIFFLEARDPVEKKSGVVETKAAMQRYREENEKRISNLKNFFYNLRKQLWVMTTEDSIKEKLPRLTEERNISI